MQAIVFICNNSPETSFSIAGKSMAVPPRVCLPHDGLRHVSAGAGNGEFDPRHRAPDQNVGTIYP